MRVGVFNLALHFCGPGIVLHASVRCRQIPSFDARSSYIGTCDAELWLLFDQYDVGRFSSLLSSEAAGKLNMILSKCSIHVFYNLM